MDFGNIGNANLGKHARSSISINQTQTDLNPEWFTMIFIDVDDTLIPSKLHRYLYRNLGIDIFNLYQQSMLKQFQYDIICAIEAIKQTFVSHYDEDIEIAVVSNASSRWLNLTINNTSDNAYFPILSHYFIDSKIKIKSAIDETHEFLCKKFGSNNKQKVNEMIAMSLNSKNSYQSKWMLKYTTYSSIINKYKRKLKKRCRKIVNIGDGETELEAINNYATTFGVDYMALKFIKNSTFNQLSYQWKYIKNNIRSIITDMDVDKIYNINNEFITDYDTSSFHDFRSAVVEVEYKRKKFKHKRNLSNISDISGTTTESHKALNVFYFDYVLKNDNNQFFTGHNQLIAIRTYFGKWVKSHALTQKTEQDKNAILKWMCTKVHLHMRGKDPYTDNMKCFKKIIQLSLCKNKEFKKAFDNYYNEVRYGINSNKVNIISNSNNKRRKSIDESKISEDVSVTIKQKINLHRKRSAIHSKHKRGKASVYNIKDGSLSLMNLGKKYSNNSSNNSQGTLTTNTPNSSKSKSIELEEQNVGMYYSDDGDYMYFSPKSQNGDERYSSSPNI